MLSICRRSFKLATRYLLAGRHPTRFSSKPLFNHLRIRHAWARTASGTDCPIMPEAVTGPVWSLTTFYGGVVSWAVPSRETAPESKLPYATLARHIAALARRSN